MIFTPDQLGGFAEYHGSTAQSETGRNYEEVAARLAPTAYAHPFTERRVAREVEIMAGFALSLTPVP